MPPWRTLRHPRLRLWDLRQCSESLRLQTTASSPSGLVTCRECGVSHPESSKEIKATWSNLAHLHECVSCLTAEHVFFFFAKQYDSSLLECFVIVLQVFNCTGCCELYPGGWWKRGIAAKCRVITISCPMWHGLGFNGYREEEADVGSAGISSGSYGINENCTSDIIICIYDNLWLFMYDILSSQLKQKECKLGPTSQGLKAWWLSTRAADKLHIMNTCYLLYLIIVGVYGVYDIWYDIWIWMHNLFMFLVNLWSSQVSWRTFQTGPCWEAQRPLAMPRWCYGTSRNNERSIHGSWMTLGRSQGSNFV